MKATDLLRKQHRQAKDLLQRLRDAGVEDRPRLLAAVSSLVRAHMQVEEEILYPRLEEQEELEDLISDSFREHDEIRTAMADLERCAPEEVEFDDLLDTLEELAILHFDGEESETLAQMEQSWTGATIGELGNDMRRRYDELTAAPQPSAR